MRRGKGAHHVLHGGTLPWCGARKAKERGADHPTFRPFRKSHPKNGAHNLSGPPPEALGAIDIRSEEAFRNGATMASRLLAVVCFLGCVQPFRTASPLLAYDCNIDPKMCANGFLSIRGVCGYKQAGGLEIIDGKTGVGGCPRWLQQEIDATCRACLQPSCSMHDRPAEQRFFVGGVQTRFTDYSTTEWKEPVRTCGGRSLGCDLSKCTSNWEVTRRFFTPTCLGTPFQVRPAAQVPWV